MGRDNECRCGKPVAVKLLAHGAPWYRMELTVYGPLRSATGAKRVRVDPAEATVRGVLDALVAAYPRAESHLVDGDGALRPSVRVTVDGERAAPDDDCPPDADVDVFPAMRGG